MKWSKITDTGKVRQNNEDSFLLCEELKLFAVADGMGGHNAGEIASKLALKTLEEVLKDNRENAVNEPDEPSYRLKKAIQKANSSIFDLSKNNSAYRGMGTTITACWLVEKELYIAHVGDSRAFIISNGIITQLTEDHSFVQKLINNGEITKEEARVHPRRNIITRALGTESTVEVDIYTTVVKSGDLILVCTDGLTNHLLNWEIKDTVLMTPDLDKGLWSLLVLALERGGHDNITAVLVEIE